MTEGDIDRVSEEVNPGAIKFWAGSNWQQKLRQTLITMPGLQLVAEKDRKMAGYILSGINADLGHAMCTEIRTLMEFSANESNIVTTLLAQLVKNLECEMPPNKRACNRLIVVTRPHSAIYNACIEFGFDPNCEHGILLGRYLSPSVRG